MKKSPHSTDEVVFTPFTEAGLSELTSWLENDQSSEVTNSFGPEILLPSLEMNQTFLSELLFPAESTYSMLVTLRTSYHLLINIGYVQIARLAREKPECAVRFMYISKAFRHKDYEYRTFVKIVDFVLKDIRCKCCLLWVSEDNYVFMSLARTLHLKLTRIGTEGKARKKRFCYMVGRMEDSPGKDRIEQILKKKFSIDVTPEEKTVPGVDVIPDYEGFKRKLREINRVHVSSKCSHKSTAYYSPIIKTSRESESPLQKMKRNTPHSYRSEQGHKAGGGEVVIGSSNPRPALIRLVKRPPPIQVGVISPAKSRRLNRVEFASPVFPMIDAKKFAYCYAH